MTPLDRLRELRDMDRERYDRIASELFVMAAEALRLATQEAWWAVREPLAHNDLLVALNQARGVLALLHEILEGGRDAPSAQEETV